MLKAVLSLNFLVQLVLLVVSFRRLKHPDFKTITEPLLFLFGAFVWEDMFVLSIFWLLATAVLFFFNSLRFTIILVLLFIAAREFYETLYWIFQQFHQTSHRPYDFGLKHLNNNSIYIIYQVASFSVGLLSLFLLIIYFIR